MIVLNESGKPLVYIESWDDITGRPAYKKMINPDEVELEDFIGCYNLSPKMPCGISTCRTEHNMGFLVVCKGGIETNIGRVCGSKRFGDKFKLLEKVFTRDLNAQRYRENIATYKNQVANDEKRIQYLWKGENQGEWCINKMHPYATTAFEEPTLNALGERARRKDSQIRRSVALSETEKQAAGGSGRFSQFRDEAVGTINGLSAFLDYKKLKSLLKIKLGDELEAFKELDEDSLNHTELRRWNKWVNSVDKRIREAQEIIEDCQRFVVRSNIEFIRAHKHLL